MVISLLDAESYQGYTYLSILFFKRRGWTDGRSLLSMMSIHTTDRREWIINVLFCEFSFITAQ